MGLTGKETQEVDFFYLKKIGSHPKIDMLGHCSLIKPITTLVFYV
jgi:hypothetical protein